VEDLTHDRARLGRLCDRLRAMTEVALTRRRDQLGHGSVAIAVHDLCVWAARSQGIDDRVPVLHPLATGDQLCVIGREFLDSVGASGDQAALERWRDEVELLGHTV
jgi:hypothetical protein